LGRLLVATDGLLKYVAPARLASIASTGDIRTAVDQLVAAAALPSGNFHDDVALVLAERHGE
jgi:serine/threonine protein phosphatase PrpC